MQSPSCVQPFEVRSVNCSTLYVGKPLDPRRPKKTVEHHDGDFEVEIQLANGQSVEVTQDRCDTMKVSCSGDQTGYSFWLINQSIKTRDAQTSLRYPDRWQLPIDACPLQRTAMMISTGPSIPWRCPSNKNISRLSILSYIPSLAEVSMLWLDPQFGGMVCVGG